MSSLNAGGRLNVNDELRSANGSYRLLMQPDGNLVLYAGTPSGSNAVWATNTWHLPLSIRPNRAVLEADGNFVLYSASGSSVWDTDTGGHPNARLDMQDDRNLVIYDAHNRPIWATMTNIPVPERRTGYVKAAEKAEVGWGKTIETEATLYRDGRLIVDSYTKNNSAVGGLRGHTFIVVGDAVGRSIWASKVFVDPTRCSIFDPSCASYSRATHKEDFPPVVGQYAESLDIFHADSPNFVDLRNSIIDGIKSTGDIARELKNEWEKLQKSLPQ